MLNSAIQESGTVIEGTHCVAADSMDYKLYCPPGRAGRRLPLVVMLHGCRQGPDDFEVGTGMNEQAREAGFFVLYPAQSSGANASRCWNWFEQGHQNRGSGEPALLAGLTQSVIEEHAIDPDRVYIAGLSAGAAMAVIVAGAYPEIFAAVGVHSGLPRGAASNVYEALVVMTGGGSGPQYWAEFADLVMQGARVPPQRPMPTIVFHGDRDSKVHPLNGEHVIEAVLDSAAACAGQSRSQGDGCPLVELGVSARGRRYTRSTHRGDNGHALTEHWLVHGGGHAWSGGRAEGSYTETDGPDATHAMVRFFFTHPRGLAC